MIGNNHLNKEDHVNKERFCSQCGEKKPGNKFISRSTKCTSCRDAIWEANIRAQGLDPEQVRRDKRNERRRLARQGQLPLGVTMRNAKNDRMRALRDHYDQKLVEQGGVCAICGRAERQLHMGKIKALCRDHNHSSGQLRGLLCTHCNSGIGHFEERPELLIAAIAYLQQYSSLDRV